MNKLETVLNQFRMELGFHLISTAIVDSEDGLVVAGNSVNPEFDVNEAAVRFAEVMRVTHDVTIRTSTGFADFDLVTTDQNYIISQFLNYEWYYWLVVVSKNATLGTVRMLMDDYYRKVSENLPKNQKEAADRASITIPEGFFDFYDKR